VCGDYTSEMGCHSRTGDKHLDAELFCGSDVLGGLTRSAVGRENSDVAWDVELVEHVAPFEHHGQIVGAARKNRDHRRIVLIEFAALHLASRTPSF
jgi:hypothetical protein